MARGNMDSDLYEALDRAQAGEVLMTITAGSIIKFSDKMLIRYIQKQDKYGHSWLKKPLKDSEKYVMEHLLEHWEHLQEEGFPSDGLTGLALMAMMIVQLREIQEKSAQKDNESEIDE